MVTRIKDGAIKAKRFCIGERKAVCEKAMNALDLLVQLLWNLRLLKNEL